MNWRDLASAISFVSLIVAFFAFLWTRRASRAQVLFAGYQKLSDYVVLKNQILIQNPALWAIYDDHASIRDKQEEDELFQEKLEAFAYFHFNVFEFAHTFYCQRPFRKFRSEDQYHEAWAQYLRQFLRESSIARKVWEKASANYAEAFRREIEAAMPTN